MSPVVIKFHIIQCWFAHVTTPVEHTRFLTEEAKFFYYYYYYEEEAWTRVNSITSLSYIIIGTEEAKLIIINEKINIFMCADQSPSCMWVLSIQTQLSLQQKYTRATCKVFRA
jgi:hypothetical protein